jgi:hypothetical protein
METPKGARLVWWTRLNAWAKALLYERLLSKIAANVFLLLKINNLYVYSRCSDLRAVAKSLQPKAEKKA